MTSVESAPPNHDYRSRLDEAISSKRKRRMSGAGRRFPPLSINSIENITFPHCGLAPATANSPLPRQVDPSSVSSVALDDRLLLTKQRFSSVHPEIVHTRGKSQPPLNP